jgi:hypothetical protein
LQEPATGDNRNGCNDQRRGSAAGNSH